jgi:clan AA aspartic protease (TIGR02281 family)
MLKKIFLLSLLLGALATNNVAQTTITMKKEGGVYVVPCKVNGIDLEFIFDTGASNVSISYIEALFMVKNRKLDPNDIGEDVYYSIADGTVKKGTKILLKEIEFAGFKLQNVEATIVWDTDAPLLLGLSAISKLGKIQINPVDNTLTILNGKDGKADYNYANHNYQPQSQKYIYVPTTSTPSKEILVNKIIVKPILSEYCKDIKATYKDHSKFEYKTTLSNDYTRHILWLTPDSDMIEVATLTPNTEVKVLKSIIKSELSTIFYYVYANGKFGFIEKYQLD